MSDIKFGTDGWRARIAEDYTFDNVRRAAQGFAQYLKNHNLAERGVVIGYDQRFSSEHFAAAAAEVMAGNGIRVWLTAHNTPTPVISYSVIERQAGGAINITASHNPPTDNGFKVRDPNGGAIPPEGLAEIEEAIPPIEGVHRLAIHDAEAAGLVQRWNPDPAYIAHLSTLIDLEKLRHAGFKILVEPMWGNGAGWFPRLLSGGNNTLWEIHAERHPLFPEMQRPEPIRPNIDAALRRTVELGADVLLIMDGDADRMGIGDENGVYINQLQVYALLAYYLLEVRGQRGAIVKTISTTSMLNRLGEMYGVDVHETGVGFKYVAPKVLETNALIGGEESGGYAFRGNVPERDGILGNLYFLDFMLQTGKTPAQLLQTLFKKLGQTYYYDRIDTRFPAEKRPMAMARLNAAKPETIAGLPVTGIVTLDGYKYELGDHGWVLIRFSGTEPIVRVYCEVTDPQLVPAVLNGGLELAGLK
ncbi:MAG TPA: phosphoglucomutase/phosphomannomutase family protein [Anaerolineae bacterium]|nr:phosphoglucomutase/phosphomannomutase family protein [Anaerolineae bacterium]HQK14608.1 phosphoglucomutase/phosphomannomutase family protein [Anaerolineae bacterium]